MCGPHMWLQPPSIGPAQAVRCGAHKPVSLTLKFMLLIYISLEVVNSQGDASCSGVENNQVRELLC